MSSALDMLRAIDRSDAAQSPANERNEINEITPAGEQVNSFNSFLSYSPDVGEGEFEERAALVEFGAGVPRAWAEGFAKLSPDRVPADVPPHRGQGFVDDVGRFLDGGFADQASALGWTPLDLF